MGKEKQEGHEITEVLPDSIAMELGIEAGDRLLAVNKEKIEDIFDYQYQMENDQVEVLVEKPDGEQWLLEVEKDEDEDIGVVFSNGLMDAYHSCRNKCIFCFIDQMPKGMRETLYFKDDDARLSFLQGNYVTLTNMSDADIERIIKYRLSPINISFQTMDSKLRCMMLNNRFAGEALKKVDRLFQAGIAMNGQIVLCKGVNDGKELGSSIRKLMGYIPVLESVSVVPVGLTKYREGLYPLEPFTPKEAGEVLDMVHGFQEEIYPKWGRHFVHASDEWYLLAGRELPPEETYDGYLQLENGVGMLRLFIDEFKEAYEGLRERLGSEGCQKQAPPIASFPCAGGGCGPALQEDPLPEDEHMGHTREISMATGKLAYPYVREMAKEMMALLPGLTIHVYEIVNYFFGEMITVAGLLTGKDIISQLTGERLGERLLLPQNMLRSGGDVFLDDVTISGMEKALQVKIGIVKSSGYDFVNAVYLQSRL